MRTPRFIVGLAGSVAVATFALGGALVSAQTVSDGRAVLVDSPGCPDGTVEIPKGVIQFQIVSLPAGQLLTIFSVDPGFTITAIVVTGGDPAASQMYNPGSRGLLVSPPWVNLQAPLQSNSVLPDISGWVACGPSTTTTTTSTTTTTAPTTTTTTTTAPTTTTTAPTTTTTDPGTTTTTSGATTTTSGATTTTSGATTTTSGATTTTAAGVTTTTIAGPTTTAARATSTLPHTGGGPNTNVIGAAVLILLAGALATMVARRQAS